MRVFVNGSGRRPCRHSAGDYSAPFFDHQFLVSGFGFDSVHLARRPTDHDGIHPGRRTQPEVQPRIAGRLKAGVGPDLCDLGQITGFDFDSRTEALVPGIYDCYARISPPKQRLDKPPILELYVTNTLR